MNSSGQVIKATSRVNAVGLLVLTQERYAGDVVDVMTAGEIVDISTVTPFDGFTSDAAGTTPAAAVAGTMYYVATNGKVTSSAPATGVNAVRVGWTVEAGRIVVRSSLIQTQ